MGFTQSQGAGEADGWIIRAGADGEKQWDRTFGAAGEDKFQTVTQVPGGGGVVIAGYTTVDGKGQQAWIMQLGPDGGRRWARSFGGTNNEWLLAVEPVPSGGYIIAGETESQGDSAGDAWLIRIGEDGETIWERTYGVNGWDRFGDVAVVPGAHRRLEEQVDDRCSLEADGHLDVLLDRLIARLLQPNEERARKVERVALRACRRPAVLPGFPMRLAEAP